MTYKDYCGYLYGYDKVEGYSIMPHDRIERPATFYKYYALSSNSVDALTNMYVYATHPYQFNDPFDCNEKLIEFDSWDDVRNLLGEKYEEIRKIYPSLEDACKFCIRAFWNLLYRKVGLVSLATRPDNYQMWSLYSENYGFCIEFNVDSFPFKHFGPFPINYTRDVPGAIHIGSDGGFIAMLIQTNIKNIWWEYENEWRLYIPNPVGLDMKYFGKENEMKEFNCGDEHDRKFRYPSQAVKSIILGPKFFDRLTTNVINSFEMNISYPINRKSLEMDALEFLAMISLKYKTPIFAATLSDFSNYNFVPIRIVKHTERSFKIFNEYD